MLGLSDEGDICVTRTNDKHESQRSFSKIVNINLSCLRVVRVLHWFGRYADVVKLYELSNGLSRHQKLGEALSKNCIVRFSGLLQSKNSPGLFLIVRC